MSTDQAAAGISQANLFYKYMYLKYILQCDYQSCNKKVCVLCLLNGIQTITDVTALEKTSFIYTKYNYSYNGTNYDVSTILHGLYKILSIIDFYGMIQYFCTMQLIIYKDKGLLHLKSKNQVTFQGSFKLKMEQNQLGHAHVLWLLSFSFKSLLWSLKYCFTSSVVSSKLQLTVLTKVSDKIV